MNILEIRSLSHRYEIGGRGIFQVDLNIRQGSFVVIAGRNGCGKTTLLKHMNGLLKPDAGDVLVDGLSVWEDLRRARRLVGMVFQDADSQIIGETVYEDAAFGPRNLRLSREEVDRRVRRALAAVGMSDLGDHRPHTLSGGEKRRLAIAGVLAMEPKILVFDEPFSNLDDTGIRQVLSQITTLHQSGHTVIVTTHDLEKTIAHADRLVVMDNGRIQQDGVPSEVVAGVSAFGIRVPCSYTYKGILESWLN